jgi:hypothetical protein
LPVLALGTSLALAASAAQADTLQSVLDLLAQAGVIDQDVANARPVIECVINGGNIENCVKQYAEQKADALLRSDSKLETAVEVIVAVQNKHWGQVIELAGTDVLKQVVCTAGVPIGGAVKDFICGGVFDVAISLGKPVIKDSIVAIESGDYWKLVTLLGVEYTCEVMPDAVPAKSEICGVLGKALNLVGKALKGAAKEAWETLAAVGEDISGQSQHMPTKQFFDDRWKPFLHLCVHGELVSGGPAMCGYEYNDCVEYFDGHRMSKSSAEEVCGLMRKSLTDQGAAVAKAMQAAPAAYFEGTLQPLVGETTQAQYASVDAWKKGIDTLSKAPNSWAQAVIYTHGKTLGDLYTFCSGTMRKAFPMAELEGNPFKGNSPPSAWDWVCFKAVQSFTAALVQDKAALDANVFPKLKAAGCSVTLTGAQVHVSSCTSYDAQAECVAYFGKSHHAANMKPVSLCGVDGGVAPKKLATKLVGELGAKRCHLDAASRVACARPWKYDRCVTKTIQVGNSIYGPGDGATMGLASMCVAVDDPAFAPGKAKAQQIINALNGLVQAPTTAPIVTTKAGCHTTWDPLAIACEDIDAFATLPQKLPGESLAPCAADPNQDGADKTCGVSLRVRPTLADKTAPAHPAVTTVPPAAAAAAGVGPDSAVALLTRGGRVEGAWNGSIATKDSDAFAAAAGECRYSLHFVLRNNSGSPSGAIQLQLAVGDRTVMRRDVPTLAANATSSQETVISLKPGSNQIALTLGGGRIPAAQSHHLSVTVAGTCGGAAPALGVRQRPPVN